MKQTVSHTKFVDAFKEYGREDTFSYGALEVLFEYLESVDENYELDVIGVCCSFTESSVQDIIGDYDIDSTECDDEFELVREFLNNNTIIVGYTHGDRFVYLNF